MFFLTGCVFSKKTHTDDLSLELDNNDIEDLEVPSVNYETAIREGIVILPFAEEIICAEEEDFIVCDFIINDKDKLNDSKKIINIFTDCYMQDGWSITPIVCGKNYMTFSANKPNKSISVTIINKTKRNPNVCVHQSLCLF